MSVSSISISIIRKSTIWCAIISSVLVCSTTAKSLPVERNKQKIKATHDHIDEDRAEMHSCECCVDYPQVNQLKDKCKSPKHEEFYYAYHHLAII